ncbi:uncharacterized protein G2W53_014092 [Senna tora]|uniref:Uncharacterized protein n=1 Tax=Senna tora TaxID=362788 RepID=A0A834U0R0_9FABA|nr:uncharacterized protein G2W53_014092 [Senna tora]
MQENPKDLSTEEQDNLHRSTKKSKPNEEDGGLTLVLPSVKELEAMTEGFARPMEESPSQPRIGDDTQMTDALNPESLIKEGNSKVVRSLTWGNNNGGAVSFRDKLMAFNGRGNVSTSVEEEDIPVLEEDWDEQERDSGNDQQMTPQVDNNNPMDNLKIPSDIPPRVDSKKVVKNTVKKPETVTGAKKSNSTAKAATGNKKLAKSSF